MSRSDDAGDGVLPFDQSDVVNGVGQIQRIVALSGYTDDAYVSSDGRCQSCGYDRGVLISHTEVPEQKLLCDACEIVLWREE